MIIIKNTKNSELDIFYPSYREVRYIKKMWANCLWRCANSPYYKNVEVCEQWLNFDNFLDWVVRENNWNWANKNSLSISRKFDQGNYHPDNCELVDKKSNKHADWWLTPNENGVYQPVWNLAKHCRENDLNYDKTRRLSKKMEVAA